MSDDLLHQTIARLERNSDEVLQRVTRIEERLDIREKSDAKRSGILGSIWGAVVSGVLTLVHQFYFGNQSK